MSTLCKHWFNGNVKSKKNTVWWNYVALMHICDYRRCNSFIEKNTTCASKHTCLKIQCWQQAIIEYFDVATQS